ncbi:hypothetical protein [Streptomyces sp. NBC_01320]|nr:hypothetical protein OG395_36110 [Streptomyces sp. NBC_01320]
MGSASPEAWSVGVRDKRLLGADRAIPHAWFGAEQAGSASRSRRCRRR